MPFQDYSNTATANTELEGSLFIGPNMARNDVRPALQQLAADGRGLYDEVVARGAGGALPAFIASLTSAAERSANEKMRDDFNILDITNGSSAANTAIASLITDEPGGFVLHLPPQAVDSTGTVALDGQRPGLIGKGPNVTTIRANYAGAVPIIDAENGASGGIYQGLLADFGISSNVVANKTAIRLHNVANWEVRGIGIPQGALLGDSIGLDLSLRQPCVIGDGRMSIVCARPVVFSPNSEWPNLCADHSRLQCAELIGTSASYPVVDFSAGCVLSNTTITGALVGGKQGIKAVNTTVLANSSNLTIRDGRHEQSMDATAYGIDLDFGSGSTILRSLLISNWATDYFQHGIKLRGVKHAHLVTVELNQGTGLTALDVTLISGGSLTLDGCVGQVDGTIVVTNGHLVSSTPSQETGNPIGSRMHWVYWVTPSDPGAAGTYDYEPLPTMTVGNVRTASFRFTFPTGSRYLRLPLCQPASMTTDADVVVRAENGRLVATFHKDGTLTAHSATGIFATTATSGKIYPTTTGQLLADTLVATAAISVEIRQ